MFNIFSSQKRLKKQVTENQKRIDLLYQKQGTLVAYMRGIVNPFTHITEELIRELQRVYKEIDECTEQIRRSYIDLKKAEIKLFCSQNNL